MHRLEGSVEYDKLDQEEQRIEELLEEGSADGLVQVKEWLSARRAVCSWNGTA